MAEDDVREEDMGLDYMEPCGPRKRSCASSEVDGRPPKSVTRTVMWSNPLDVFKSHSVYGAGQ